jgi:hypothetical protein
VIHTHCFLNSLYYVFVFLCDSVVPAEHMFREIFSPLKSRGIYNDVSTERLFRTRLYLDLMELSIQGATS